jgi:hypothetical protein
VLWLVCLGAHLLYEGVTARDSALSGLGAATTVLYFGVSLGIQRLLFAARTAASPTATGHQARRNPEERGEQHNEAMPRAANTVLAETTLSETGLSETGRAA